MPIHLSLILKTEHDTAGKELLLVFLRRGENGQKYVAQGMCCLPADAEILADDGMTVGQFLASFHSGESSLMLGTAKAYGRRLRQCLFRDDRELGHEWRKACESAESVGLRLEIQVDAQASWADSSLAAVPFELLADDKGFLFRRHNWRTLRSIRNLPTRLPRAREADEVPKIMLGYANVKTVGGERLPDEHFLLHEGAIRQLALSGKASCLPTVQHASRKDFAQALKKGKPEVLVWVGHGAAGGSELILHDRNNQDYPADLGAPVAAVDFANDVRQGEVDLAFLWSCHGAGAVRSLDIGVAEALLDPTYGDLTAVVASYSDLHSDAVAAFSRDVIDAWIADPTGDLEQALAGARAQLDEHDLDWAQIVLLSRAKQSTAVYQLTPETRIAEPPPGSRTGWRWLPDLPSSTLNLIGREDLLAAAEGDLRINAVVALEGLPGIGKTEVALTLARRWCNAGKDVGFVEVSQLGNYGNLLARIGQWRGLEKDNSEAALLSAYKDVEWLLFIDNAEDILADEAIAPNLLGLLQGFARASDSFRCLVTSRRSIGARVDGIRVHEVQPLNTAAARQLFIDRAGLRFPHGEQESTAFDALLEELGGIPLALVLMASQLGAEVGLATLRARLQEYGVGAIASVDVVGDVVEQKHDWRFQKDRLASALNLVYKAASTANPDAALLFDVFGTFPAGLAQNLLPVEDYPWLSEALAVLLQCHLVSLVGEEWRLSQPAPIRKYALERLQQRGGDNKMRSLLVGIHSRFAFYSRQNAKLIGTVHAATGLRWLVVEEANLLDALSLYISFGTAQGAEVFSSVAEDLTKSFLHGGRVREGLKRLAPLYEAAAETWPATIAAALALRLLGDLHMHAEELVAARQIYEKALNQSRLIGDNLSEANTLNALGSLKVHMDDPTGARQDHLAALPLFRSIPDCLGEANSLHSLGDLDLRENRLPQAREHFEAATKLYRDSDNLLGEANTLASLGNLCLRENDQISARKAYQKAIQRFQDIRSSLGEANALVSLGNLEQREKRFVEAHKAFAQALLLSDRIGNRLGQANARQAAGRCLCVEGDLTGAFGNLLEALRIHTEIKNRQGKAACHAYLARVAFKANQRQQAIGLAVKALEMIRRVGDCLDQKIVYMDVAVVLGGISQDCSLACCYLAWQIARKIGDTDEKLLGDFFNIKMKQAMGEAGWVKMMHTLESLAHSMLDDLIAKTTVAIDSGEINLYVLPGEHDAE